MVKIWPSWLGIEQRAIDNEYKPEYQAESFSSTKVINQVVLFVSMFYVTINNFRLDISCEKSASNQFRYHGLKSEMRLF